MNLQIRPLKTEDVPALARMEEKIFSRPWSEQSFADLLKHDYILCFVAETDGIPIGCAGLTMLDNEGNIDKVMVREDFRGRGVAYQMLERLLEEARKRGITEFTLEVRVGNRPAIHLYEKLGFVSEGVRPKFYDKPMEDAMIMWRRSKERPSWL